VVTVGGVSRPCLLGEISGHLVLASRRSEGSTDVCMLTSRITTHSQLPDLYLEFLAAFGIDVTTTNWSAERSRMLSAASVCDAELVGSVEVVVDRDRDAIVSVRGRSTGTVTVILRGRMPEANRATLDAKIVYAVESEVDIAAGTRDARGLLSMSPPTYPVFEWSPR